MTPEEAYDTINAALNVQARPTTLTGEVKCWTPATEDAGVDETYLSAADCRDLAEAFVVVAGSLSSGKERP